MIRAITANEILLLPIVWRKVREGLWKTQVHDADCILRMNNFPEESLYTIMVSDSSLDVDDAPPAWTVEW